MNSVCVSFSANWGPIPPDRRCRLNLPLKLIQGAYFRATSRCGSKSVEMASTCFCVANACRIKTCGPLQGGPVMLIYGLGVSNRYFATQVATTSPWGCFRFGGGVLSRPNRRVQLWTVWFGSMEKPAVKPKGRVGAIGSHQRPAMSCECLLLHRTLLEV